MITMTVMSRQLTREPWTLERLNHERSILLGLSIDSSTALAYSSALKSYLTFCRIHNLPIEPTPDTLSYYITFQSSFISPVSVTSYLSGICNQLEPFFPNVRQNRSTALVVKTLKGARRRHGKPTKRKSPLTREDLQHVHGKLSASSMLDDKLFLAMLMTGFFGLLRLGEMVFPDNVGLRDFQKVTMQLTLSIEEAHYVFTLPTHKSDKYFEGDCIVVQKSSCNPDPLACMLSYVTLRDRLFPLHPTLWLHENGTVPSRSWFLSKLRTFFSSEIAGHSMRAGGATALAQAGASPEIIKAAGRWTSDAFEQYIRKNPFLLHALILGRTSAYDRVL